MTGLLDDVMDDEASPPGLLADVVPRRAPPMLGLHSYGDAASFVTRALKGLGLIGIPFGETPIGKMAAARGLPIADRRRTEAMVEAMLGFGVGPMSAVSRAGAARGLNIRSGNDALARFRKDGNDVMNAMERAELGPISFRKGGLEHIRADHGDDALSDVPRVIANGHLSAPYKTSAGRDRIDVVLGDRKVVLSPNYRDEPGYWVVSSFKLDR